MKRLLTAVVACVSVSASASAQNQQPFDPADYTRMGPWTRKPTNEEMTRKEVQAFIKQEEELWKRRDMDAMLQRIDFPVFMATDDAKGRIEARLYNREQYVQMMQPMMESMPADHEMKHKTQLTVLSDNMVNVVDDFTMTMNKQKYAGRSSWLLVKTGGQWKWKAMAEPGWGGMSTAAAQTGARPSAPGATPPTQR